MNVYFADAPANFNGFVELNKQTKWKKEKKTQNLEHEIYVS